MRDDARKASALRWRGILAEGTQGLRRAAAVIMALACTSSIFTQWGYIGVQLADGSCAYIMLMLAPVALSALLLGTVSGMLAGLFSGVMLYLHALIAPLDYFEFAYVTPITSIVAATVVGVVAGLLFSHVLRAEGMGRKYRWVLFALTCLMASCVFSTIFDIGLLLHPNPDPQTIWIQVTFKNTVIQIIADAAILTFVTLLTNWLVEWAGLRANSTGLRELFAARLLGVVLITLMVFGMVAYANVTVGNLVISLDDMKSEVDYLLRLVEQASEHDQKDNQFLLGMQDDTSKALTAHEEHDPGEMTLSLIKGYTEDEDGLVIVALEGRVLGVDTDRLNATSGDNLESFLGKDVLAAIQRSVESGTLEQVIYLAPFKYDNVIDLTMLNNAKAASVSAIPQVGYLVAQEHDGFLVALIRPATMVFDGRDDVVRWINISLLGLLLVVSALVRRLLDRMVARRIDATNATLMRITNGDLNARVKPEGTFEFQELSVGINHTVDTLQGWIAEAERRMDSELATARAIQESALPSVFPPFPEIRRFDIFASMNPAREVGGDFYDFFLIGDDSGPVAGRLAFVIADVSGKGVPAALFMMQAKTQIRDYIESGMELGEAVENANHRLCEGNEEGMFVTAWVGVLDYGSGHLDYVNAGHNRPLLWHGGAWRWLEELSGLPLGLYEESTYTTYSMKCQVGDQILLYTDGVTEAFSVDEEQYGEDRLMQVTNESFVLHPHELVERVCQSVAEYSEGAEQSDDITILALEVGVPPEEMAQLVVPAKVDEFPRVAAFIHTELDRRLCPARVQTQLGIAVEELFVNSCSYAYEGMDESIERLVRVTYSYCPDPVSVTVEIIDGGVPFNPLLNLEDEPIDASKGLDDIGMGGLGILMAQKSVDEMRYERVGESNVVTLVKHW